MSTQNTVEIIDPKDGTIFGSGQDRESAMADAIENAYWGEDDSEGVTQWRPATRAWLETQLRTGTLVFGPAPA